MVNLIITLIGIALVAITAVIALFALGDTFTKGGTQAEEARLQNEANHIIAASELFLAERGTKALSVSQLVDSKYLRDDFRGLGDGWHFYTDNTGNSYLTTTGEEDRINPGLTRQERESCITENGSIKEEIRAGGIGTLCIINSN